MPARSAGGLPFAGWTRRAIHGLTDIRGVALITSSKRGKAAELLAQAWLLEQGMEVFDTVNDASSCDLCFRDPRVPLILPETVQVKRVYKKDGSLTINLTKSKDKKYGPLDATWILGVEVECLLFWLIPLIKVYEKTRVVLGDSLEKYLYDWDTSPVDRFLPEE